MTGEWHQFQSHQGFDQTPSGSLCWRSSPHLQVRKCFYTTGANKGCSSSQTPFALYLSHKALKCKDGLHWAFSDVLCVCMLRQQHRVSFCVWHKVGCLARFKFALIRRACLLVTGCKYPEGGVGGWWVCFPRCLKTGRCWKGMEGYRHINMVPCVNASCPETPLGKFYCKIASQWYEYKILTVMSTISSLTLNDR